MDARGPSRRFMPPGGTCSREFQGSDRASPLRRARFESPAGRLGLRTLGLLGVPGGRHALRTAFAARSSSHLETSDRIKEELDGAVTLGWQGFLIQSKLQADPIPFEPIARLHLQVGRRPEAPWASFFARNYSDAADELGQGAAADPRVALWRHEIHWALTQEPPLDMLAMVRRKWRIGRGSSAARTASLFRVPCI